MRSIRDLVAPYSIGLLSNRDSVNIYMWETGTNYQLHVVPRTLAEVGLVIKASARPVDTPFCIAAIPTLDHLIPRSGLFLLCSRLIYRRRNLQNETVHFLLLLFCRDLLNLKIAFHPAAATAAAAASLEQLSNHSASIAVFWDLS